MHAARRRVQLRAMGGAFDLWLQYTRAMTSGGIDPGSPYMSPRSRGDERRLITRMAAMAGNVGQVRPCLYRSVPLALYTVCHTYLYMYVSMAMRGRGGGALGLRA